MFFLKVAGYVSTGQRQKAAELLNGHADKALSQAVKNDPSKESLMYLLFNGYAHPLTTADQF